MVNRVAELWAGALWLFVDVELNMEILAAVGIMLRAEANMYGARIGFARGFEEAGGRLRLQRVL